MKKRVRERNDIANSGFSKGGSLERTKDRLHSAKAISKVILSLILVLCLLLLAFAVFIIVKFALVGGNDAPARVTVVYGEISVRKNYEDVFIGGTVFVDMDTLSELLSLTRSADGSSVTYTTSGGDSLVLTAGKLVAIVNGMECSISNAPRFDSEGHLLVPSEIIERFISDTSVSCSADQSRVSVLTVIGNGETVTFSPKKSDNMGTINRPSSMPPDVNYDPNGTKPAPPPTSAPESTTSPETTSPETDPPASALQQIIDSYVFLTDISSIKQYLNPEDKESFLILVNRENPLGSSYKPKKLTTIESSLTYQKSRKYELDETAYIALSAMLAEMKASDIKNIYVCSSYRSYSYQKTTYNNYISKEKKNHPDYTEEQIIALVDSYSARPGTSDHQTGLCVDFWVTPDMKELENYGHEGTKNDKGFAETEAYVWLRENAYKFGFIMRFPEGKTDITGYQYESWHWRFVGQEAAYEIYTNGLCLEEYLALSSGGVN